MEKTKELKSKVNEIIENNQIPNEVKEKVKNICLEYENACKDYKRRIFMAQTMQNENKVEMLLKGIDSLYKEDSITLDTIMKLAYEEKKQRQIRDINSYLDGRSIEPVIFDTKQEEYYKENKDEIEVSSAIKNRLNNEDFIRLIEQNIKIQIDESKKDIQIRIESSNVFGVDEKQRLYKDYIKNNFIEQIDVIEKKITEDLPEIGKVLDIQDDETYQRIMDVIMQYKKELEQEELTPREKFASELHVDANKEEVAKKIKEESKAEKNIPSLPGDIIK